MRALCVCPSARLHRILVRSPSRGSRGAASCGVALTVVAPAPSCRRTNGGASLDRRSSAAAALALGFAQHDRKFALLGFNCECVSDSSKRMILSQGLLRKPSNPRRNDETASRRKAADSGRIPSTCHSLKAGRFFLGFGAGGRLPIWNGVGGFMFNSSSSVDSGRGELPLFVACACPLLYVTDPGPFFMCVGCTRQNRT